MDQIQKGSKRGQALVEFVFVGPLGLLMITSILGILFYLGIRSALNVDAYTLARAHLYGHNQNECKVSPFWPQNSSFFALLVSCRGNAEVTEQFKMGKQTLSRAHWNLEP